MTSNADNNLTDKRIREEIAHYANVVNVHELPPIFHYWSNTYLKPKVQSLGFESINHIFLEHIDKVHSAGNHRAFRMLSVGAGNCDFEVNLAQAMEKQGMSAYQFICLDINPHMLERGKAHAIKAGLTDKFIFLNTDVNGWKIDDTYHVILANQSLHHFVELEMLFDKIHKALHPDGFFMTHDMIGRNGHMKWPEALEYIHGFWSLLEDRHKYNHQLKRLEPIYENWDCSKEGFEGIRSQDILPLLLKTFKFSVFLGFRCLVSVFVDRSFGHNFDPNNQWDKTFIDFVAKLDDYYIELGKIKPTQMVAVMTKRQNGPIKTYKHLSPEFCVRISDGKDPLAMSNKKTRNILTKLLKRS